MGELVDLLLGLERVDLVGVVGGVGERGRPDAVDEVAERALAALAADEHVAALDPLHGVEVRRPGAVLVLAREAVEHEREPSGAALHEADLEVREAVDRALPEERDEVDDERQRVVEDVGRAVVDESLHAQVEVGAAVEREHAPEPLRLLVDGPVHLVAEVHGEPARGEHRARQAEVLDGAAQLLHGLRHVLHGDEPHRVQAVAHLAVAGVDVVVEAPADGDGVVRVLDDADGEPLGGEHDRLVDLGALEEGDPVLAGAHAVLAGVDAFASCCTRRSRLRHVHAVQAGEEPADVPSAANDRLERLRHEVEHLRTGLDDVPVAVDDGESALRHCLPSSTSRFSSWADGTAADGVCTRARPSSVIPAPPVIPAKAGNQQPRSWQKAAFLIRFFFRSLRVRAGVSESCRSLSTRPWPASAFFISRSGQGGCVCVPAAGTVRA